MPLFCFFFWYPPHRVSFFFWTELVDCIKNEAKVTTWIGSVGEFRSEGHSKRTWVFSASPRTHVKTDDFFENSRCRVWDLVFCENVNDKQWMFYFKFWDRTLGTWNVKKRNFSRSELWFVSTHQHCGIGFSCVIYKRQKMLSKGSETPSNKPFFRFVEDFTRKLFFLILILYVFISLTEI